MGTTRYVYNRAIDILRRQTHLHVSSVDLTSILITRKKRDGTLNKSVPEWTFETPKDIRKGAVRDLEKAFKSAFTNLKRGNIKRFYMKKKTGFQSVEIPNTAIQLHGDSIEIYPRYKLGNIKVSKRELRKELEIEGFCRLQFERNQWFLVVPYTKESKSTKPEFEVCALDPGVRTFQTLYSPEKVVKFQHNRELLKTLQKKVRKFQALRKAGVVRPYSCKRRVMKTFRQIDNLVSELHYQVISELQNYQHVLLPIFETQGMMKGNQLSSSTKLEMSCLSHYRFKRRLQSAFASNEFSNVHIVKEHYTSKTCGNCGTQYKVGSGEIYNCQNCGLIIDRDVNGARNILLKHLVQI
jgi:putative transposase